MVRRLVGRIGGHHGLTAGQVHVDPPGVLLGGILQSEFLADLFDARLDLLNMAGGMVALADDPERVLEDHVLTRPALPSTDGLKDKQNERSWEMSEHTHEGESVHALWHI